MTLLSRVLPYRANRWANMVAGALKTAVVAASLFVGTPTLYYVFFATIEIACTIGIVVLAWKWKNDGPLAAAERGDSNGLVSDIA